MARVYVPQSACAGLTFDGRHVPARNGAVELPDNLARRAVKFAECFTPSNAPFGADGFVCTACGFHAVFRTCGRCGGACVRPAELPERSSDGKEPAR